MLNPQKHKRTARLKRHARVRARIAGTASRPRLSVFRSHQWINAQLIDDTAGQTLLAAFEKVEKLAGLPVERARALGKILSARAREKGISVVVFDRGGYAYHGRVAAFAQGAREGGLQF